MTWDEELCGPPPPRAVAPEGDDAWRHMAWPVADALFSLEPPPTAGDVLVAGGDGEERAAVAADLEQRAVPVRVRERLDVDGLRACPVVVLLGGRDALPALAFAPLAARRLLVAPRRDRTFGLQEGIEFLAGASPDELAERAAIAHRHPEAFAIARTLGAIAAERQRASALIGRLQRDLELLGGA